MESRVEVQVSEDGLEARLCVVPGRASNREELDSALSEAGVCKGFIDEALDSLATGLADPNHACRDVLVANGQPARNGSDGELDFSLSRDLPASHVEPPAKKGKAPEGYFSVVIPRQEIAVYEAPRKGEAGWSVRGEVLPCTDGKDPLDLIGEGLECTPNGTLNATMVGVVIRRKGEELRVRPLPAEKRLLVSISEDSMSAKVRVFPGETGDANTLGSVLAQAGVTAGIVPDAQELLAEKLADPLFAVDGLVVAEGSEPIPGTDGVFSPNFAEEAPAGSVAAGKVDEKGQIDFRNRSLLQPVEADELLGVYSAATKGEPGTTVLGEPLPAPAGAERMPNLGNGIDKKKAPDTICARRAGVILYQEAKQLDVVDASEHRGDVDLSSGNLRVGGSVVISGSVMSNARVEATGDVVIAGLVEGGWRRE
ncbi:MAG: DUF342 domain-containing protein [bacterium]|nr:DUF342 domain-containing protein [bacterium]